MRVRKTRCALIHRSSLGGYTIEGPYRRRTALRELIAKLRSMLGGAR